MPDCWENAESISCCMADSVGTGLLEGVGAGATNARRISSVVAFRTNISSFTIHMLKIQEKAWSTVAHGSGVLNVIQRFGRKALRSISGGHGNEDPRESSV